MPSRACDGTRDRREGVTVREYDRLFIDGDWVKSTGSGTIEVISPGTEEPIGRVPDSTEADIDAAVAAARRAFDSGPWPRTSPAERADLLAAVSATHPGAQRGDRPHHHRAERLAHLVVADGPGFSATMVLDYYVGLAREYPFEEVRAGRHGPDPGAPGAGRRGGAPSCPGTSPCSSPCSSWRRRSSPAARSSSSRRPRRRSTPTCWPRSSPRPGCPQGVVNIVPAGREVGEHLVTHPDVDKIGFTGSTAAGRRIAALCGERLKRVHPRARRQVGGDRPATTPISTTVAAGLRACVAHEQRRRRASPRPGSSRSRDRYQRGRRRAVRARSAP